MSSSPDGDDKLTSLKSVWYVTIAICIVAIVATAANTWATIQSTIATRENTKSNIDSKKSSGGIGDFF